MAARVIDGKAVAARVREQVAREVAQLHAERGVQPGLATVLVGDDPASQVYVRNKRAACEAAGMRSIHCELGGDATQAELADTVRALAEDEAVHGILVQLPLPDGLDADEAIVLIPSSKDVDGLTPVNAGLLAQGRPALVPCTPAGVIELLWEAGTELDGARAVIVGRSRLVGRPLAALLVAENATVTVCHSRTRDLAEVCRRAEVLIAAVGSPRLVSADMVGEGATVIDVGINRVNGALVGDVDFEGAAERASAITPVPGGVGPMTIAMLLRNTLTAAERSAAAVV